MKLKLWTMILSDTTACETIDTEQDSNPHY